MKRLTNREIVEILYHNVLVLDPRIKGIELQNGQKLLIKDGELWKDK